MGASENVKGPRPVWEETRRGAYSGGSARAPPGGLHASWGHQAGSSLRLGGLVRAGSSLAGAERVKAAAGPPLSVSVRTGRAAGLAASRGRWAPDPAASWRVPGGPAAGLEEECAGAARSGGLPWALVGRRRLREQGSCGDGFVQLPLMA